MLDNKLIIENEVFIKAKFNLAGTLTIPNNPKPTKLPAVLLIAGSGKMDRDVNAPQIKTNIFKLLSKFFVEQGIISLRYDKRGCGKSAGDYNSAGFSDFIEDARSAFEYLKSHELVDEERVFILGHSEGAFIAPAVNDLSPAAGLILLCGCIDSGKDLLPVQPQKVADEIRMLKGIKGRLLCFLKLDKFIVWQFKRTQMQSLATSMPVIKIFGLFKFNAKWLREFYHFNVKDYLASIKCPTLVVGAGKDIQVEPEAAHKIAQEIDAASSLIVANMNHLLLNYSGTHTFLECAKQYRESVKDLLSPDLLRELKDWMSQY